MISVIVPIYNSEKYLDECLQSIANQTFKELEVLLINDGSTDSSQSICEEYCSKYSNFRLINKENGGQMSAWILGVQEAKGKFFGFVDSDDFIEPTMFEKMFKMQQKHNADLVMCDRNVVDMNSNIINNSQKNNLKEYYSKEEMDDVKSMFLPTLTGNLSQARWDKLFKKEIYLKCTEKYCKTPVRTFEDRFIVIPYVFYSESFAFVDEHLYNWRQVEMSSSRKPRPELCDIADLLFESHKTLINDLSIYDRWIGRIELEKVDILRNIFERNVCGKRRLKEKIHYSALILSNNNRFVIAKHKKECVGRFGKHLLLCSKLNSPFLLSIGSYLKNENKEIGH